LTLVIALACKDGIVVASDGQATLNSSGGPVRQKAVKIKQIEKHPILWAGSGEVGFLQKIEKGIKMLPAEIKKANFDKLQECLIRIVHELRKKALDHSTQLYGYQGGLKNASSADLLFCTYADTVKILHINQDAKDEELQEFGFGATGIGDTFAYTLLKGTDIPSMNCQKGVVLAYGVIHEAIEVGAFGLGEPIDIWIIHKTKKKNKHDVETHRLNEEEIAAVTDTYTTIKQAEAEIFETQFQRSKREERV